MIQDKPLKLPRFVCICGEQPELTLAHGLTVFNPDHAVIKLRDWKYETSWSLPMFTQDPVFEEKITRSIERRLGFGFYIQTFIKHLEVGAFDHYNSFIFPDAYAGDAKDLTDKYGESTVLLLLTGPLQAISTEAKQIWLPTPSTTERLRLLTRELGYVDN